MTRHDDSGGVSALVRHTAGMAELAINAGHPDRKHNEYLPYPDNNFNDPIDERFQRADKFTVAHIFDRSGRTFVPNVPVHVTSIVAERIYAGFAEFLNPYLYCITTIHGPFQWTIYKRYRHFNELHKSLVQFVEAELKQSISDIDKVQDEENEIPCFPTRSDRMAFINDAIVKERCQILLEYLNRVLKHPKFRNHPATREFFDVSCVSFVYGISSSIKEGHLLKRSHDDYRGHNIFFRLPFFCDFCKFHHGRKWFIIKDSYITYMRPDTYEIRFPMLVDRAFDIETGFRNVRTQHGIKITNLQRSLVLKCRNKRDCDEWTQHLMNLKEQSKSFLSSHASRFNSFAPVRQKQLAHWFINGKSYMESVAKALLTAKEEVFITDWWLSPEIMMIRPTDDDSFRLDNLLGKIADDGIRVYVLVFKEVSFAMGLNSLHTKRALIGKSKKGFIKVIRHPDHYPSGGVFLWSHHEKLVIIDQKIAFVGGIDLCFGRWDDEFMRLVDLGEENVTKLKMPEEIEADKRAAGGKETVEASKMATTEMAENAGEHPAKGTDQMRTTVSPPNKGSEDVKSGDQTHASGTGHHLKTGAKKWIEAKLSGHDGDGGDSDSEKGNHRVSRKPLMRTFTNAETKLTNKQPEQDEESQRMSNWRHSKINLNRLRSLDTSDIGQGDHAAYTNAATSSHRFRSHNAFNKFVNQTIDFARHEHHGTESRIIEGDEEAVRPQKYAGRWRKLAKIMRKSSSEDHEDSEDEEKPEEPQSIIGPSPVIDTKHRYFVGKDYSNPYEKDFELLEKFADDCIDRKLVPRMPWHDEALVVFGEAARDVARHFIQRWNIHKCEKFLYNDSYPFLLPKTYDDREELRVTNWKEFLDSPPYRVDAQCVRSVGPWSIGTKTIESSIQNAYIQMIDAAKYYIYIENQFFITMAEDAVVKNQLAEALYRRIIRAHASREKFRIYIVLPLLPGFDNVNAVQAVLYFIMRSITKGEGSLYKRLEKEGVPADDYISFYGMRAHDVLMGTLVTEIIYVHSKLMIIDDRMAICGSANINDRSLRGHRDSEVGMIINDRDEEDGVFNGQRVRVGKFCASWRKRLFSMLLGIQFENPQNIDLSDPVSDEFYNYFRDLAKKNTLIYEEIFATLPSDRVRKFDQVGQYTEAPKLKDTDPIQAQEKLKHVQGFVVEYPLYFLDDENYLPSLRTREGLVPNVMWT
ncbi:unnamed protein product [Adineta steineri]|uniref:Phospholipase n=2 Tax=Adineta steineri TaxID=433720 RepID=A0A815XQZ8_9BILA|nr:unnamed protein product [Adineta steineri]CAF1560462.1 unnamed protein product [Adineta steineri]CAF1560657.1 unnamed protein product [Adineta steineri]